MSRQLELALSEKEVTQAEGTADEAAGGPARTNAKYKLPEGLVNGLPHCTWKPSVALDPKHRPQVWRRPATTVRRGWCWSPQEAHLLEEDNWRYRRLSADEIELIQGFEPGWFDSLGLAWTDRVRAIGDAVPPPLARAVVSTLLEGFSLHTPTAMEVCAGSGGLATGAEGLRHLALIERDPTACRILRGKGTWDSDAVVETDIHDFDFAPFAGKVGLLSGGPPCQPWSQSGHSEGFLDPRDLLGSIHELVGALQPSAFVFENVPGLIAADNAKYCQAVLERLRNPLGADEVGLQYGVVAGILNAADYGVPQVRRRLFIIGLRDAPNSEAYRLFDTIHARATHRDPRYPHHTRKPWVTLAQSLKHLPDPGGWKNWVTRSSHGA